MGLLTKNYSVQILSFIEGITIYSTKVCCSSSERWTGNKYLSCYKLKDGDPRILWETKQPLMFKRDCLVQNCIEKWKKVEITLCCWDASTSCGLWRLSLACYDLCFDWKRGFILLWDLPAERRSSVSTLSLVITTTTLFLNRSNLPSWPIQEKRTFLTISQYWSRLFAACGLLSF